MRYNNAGANDIFIFDDKTVQRGPWSSMIFVPGEQWYTNGEAFWISANFGTWTPNNSSNLEELAISGHNAYPNPTTGLVELTYNLMEAGNTSIIVRDITGKVVIEKNEGSLSLGAHKSFFDLSNLSEGIYTYELKVNNNSTFGKVVLTK